MTKLQARFWVDHKGSPVRIKLNKGQSLGHSYGGATDEAIRGHRKSTLSTGARSFANGIQMAGIAMAA